MNENIIESARSINQSVQQLYTDIQNGENESAVLMGEHLLIEAYTLWNKSQKIPSATPDAAFTLAMAASAYCDALASVGNFRDAYGISLGAITNIVNIESTASSTPQFSHSMLQLYLTVWQNLHRILSSATPAQEPEVVNHVETITRYIGSMLYHYYYAVGHQSPDNPLLMPAYEAIRDISSLIKIETETISVSNTPVKPTASLPLIRDLVARSNALSLINLD